MHEDAIFSIVKGQLYFGDFNDGFNKLQRATCYNVAFFAMFLIILVNYSKKIYDFKIAA